MLQESSPPPSPRPRGARGARVGKVHHLRVAAAACAACAAARALLLAPSERSFFGSALCAAASLVVSAVISRAMAAWGSRPDANGRRGHAVEWSPTTPPHSPSRRPSAGRSAPVRRASSGQMATAPEAEAINAVKDRLYARPPPPAGPNGHGGLAPEGLLDVQLLRFVREHGLDVRTIERLFRKALDWRRKSLPLMTEQVHHSACTQSRPPPIPCMSHPA